jgi:hypothetical protein
MAQSVRFTDPVVTVTVLQKEDPHRIEPSGIDDHPVASWYLPMEYQQILLSMQVEMRQCWKQRRFHNYQNHPQQNEQTIVDASYCARGLLTPRQLERRSRDTQRSIQAVLNEQDRQRAMRLNVTRIATTPTTLTASSSSNDDNSTGCCYDSNLLAEVYRGYCLHCQVDAERLGRQDAMAAAKIYQEDNDDDYSTTTPTTMEPSPKDRIPPSASARIEITRRSKSQSPPLSLDNNNNNKNNNSSRNNNIVSSNNNTDYSSMVRTSTVQRRRRFPWSVSGNF